MRRTLNTLLVTTVFAACGGKANQFEEEPSRDSAVPAPVAEMCDLIYERWMELPDDCRPDRSAWEECTQREHFGSCIEVQLEEYKCTRNYIDLACNGEEVAVYATRLRADDSLCREENEAANLCMCEKMSLRCTAD